MNLPTPKLPDNCCRYQEAFACVLAVTALFEGVHDSCNSLMLQAWALAGLPADVTIKVAHNSSSTAKKAAGAEADLRTQV